MGLPQNLGRIAIRALREHHTCLSSIATLTKNERGSYISLPSRSSDCDAVVAYVHVSFLSLHLSGSISIPVRRKP